MNSIHGSRASAVVLRVAMARRIAAAPLLIAVLIAGSIARPASAAISSQPITSINFGFDASSMAVSRDGHFAYVVEQAGYRLAAINLQTHQVKIAKFGEQLTQLALSPDGTEIFVTTNGRSVLVIDSATLKQESSIDVGGYSGDIILSPNGRYAYVVSYRHIDEIDTSDNRVVRSGLYLPPFTDNMAISPDGRILYLFSPAYGEGVNKSVNGQLALMCTATLHVTAKHNTGFVLNPCGFAVNPNGTSLFESFCGGSVSGPQEFGVKVLNPNTGLIEKSIPFPRGSRGVVFSPGGKWAYVSDNASSQLDVINTKSDRIVRRVSLPGSSQNTAFGSFPIPLDLLSMSPDGRTIYACPGDILSPDRSIEIIPTPRP